MAIRRRLPPAAPPYTRDFVAKQWPGIEWSIGEHTYGVPEIRYLGEPAMLTIGKYCSISTNVVISLGGEHITRWATTYPFSHIDGWPEAHEVVGHPATKGDVRIGNDVWLADRCTILSGVTIGNGAVVGAGAVVSRDVAPYAIVAGNPAREIRKRFSGEVIAQLLELKWWDWSEAEIKAALPLMLADDIEAFLRAGRPKVG